MVSLSQTKIQQYVEEQFDKNVLPGLKEYISIPNTSRLYDPNWETNGLLSKAACQLYDWVHTQQLKNSKISLLEEPSRTPMLFIEVEGTTPNSDTVLFYGHLDKQPHMTGWREGLGPTKPVIEGDKLYGRGTTDDGYSLFASVLAIKACQDLELPHPRFVITIEADEESESKDLLYFLDLLKDRIGYPSMIICLDSGGGSFEHLWIATSLRGFLQCSLTIKILTEGVHSGDASGVVPDTMRILRILLDRLENPQTGEMHKDFYVDIPSGKIDEAKYVSSILVETMKTTFKFVPTGRFVDEDPVNIYFNRMWKPALVVTGIDNIPRVNVAGNVLRPETKAKLSIRLPPTLQAKQASESLREILLKDPPYGAEVTLDNITTGTGWHALPMDETLRESINNAALNYFGKNAVYTGDGGSIPFVNMLAKRFPKCNFMVTGVWGPGTNCHGPNEFLHIPYTKKFICCLIEILTSKYTPLKKV